MLLDDVHQLYFSKVCAAEKNEVVKDGKAVTKAVKDYWDLYDKQLEERRQKMKKLSRQRAKRKDALVQIHLALREEQQDKRESEEQGHGLEEIEHCSENDRLENVRLRENRPQKTQVHIRVQNRGTRKHITTVQNLSSDLDLPKIKDHLQRQLKINGTIVESEEYGTVIQLTGDKRAEVKKFLSEHNICKAELIKVH
jgi:translation initiation factor 1